MATVPTPIPRGSETERMSKVNKLGGQCSGLRHEQRPWGSASPRQSQLGTATLALPVGQDPREGGYQL